ncbi:MAG TPA: hypothetical protein PK765_04880 [bacterium]|nr:hypothetical protein [bacterium]
MLSQNGLTVSRELLGGNNIRADGNLLLSTDDLNKILRGGGGRPLSPEEFHALENALRARVNETVERLRSSARYQPAVEKASNEAVRSVAAIRDELAQRFNAPS